MSEIKITLEMLYDILRTEKKREDLQKLEESFFKDVVFYVREKKSLLESKEKSTNIFAVGERDKLEYEIRSIKRILKEIYEKREKKIIDITINKSRTGSDIIDTSAMLQEEKEFYQETLKILDGFRRGIVWAISEGNFPGVPQQRKLVQAGNAREQAPGNGDTVNEALRDDVRDDKNAADSGKDAAEKLTGVTTSSTPETTAIPLHAENAAADAVPKEKTKIRFIRPMPSFIWKDMNVYGPFDAGEELEIYPEVAELIIRKGRAVKV